MGRIVRKPSAASLAILPVPKRCLEFIGLDFGFGLPKYLDGNTGSVVYAKRLFRTTYLAFVPVYVGGEYTARLVIDRVFFQNVLPVAIVSVHTPLFTS